MAKATIEKMTQHLKSGGIVFSSDNIVSWIADGKALHLKKSTIKSLYNSKVISNYYICAYSNGIKLN
jgi:hypothetical protein